MPLLKATREPWRGGHPRQTIVVSSPSSESQSFQDEHEKAPGLAMGDSSWACMLGLAKDNKGLESLEAAVEKMQEQQAETQLQLAEHEKRIAELEDQLKRTDSVVLESELPDFPNTKGGKKLKSKAERITTHGVTVSLYEFDHSMWDASILLFVGNQAFTDRVILITGMLLNIGMQAALLAVVMADMLEPHYNNEFTEKLLEWRVSHGQAEANFDAQNGKPQAWMLCNQRLWGFEQSQYDEMHDYLYKPVPGIVLSMLAVVLWVLTCIAEYRAICEQFLALQRLPAVSKGEPTMQALENGNVVLGIRPAWRIVSFITLSLPRCAVLVSLCTVGCIYLARTVSLADIVLNAVALAFVLDVDEALCHVLLSQRLRQDLDNMQPIPCGSAASTLGGIAIKDLIRYAIALVIIITTTFAALVPFHADVVGAATALCGGDKDFTYTGGSLTTPMITVSSSADWVSTCTPAVNVGYMAEYYAGFNSSLTAETSSNADEELRLKTLVTQRTLEYAFRDCEAGYALDPEGDCAAVPVALAEVLTPIGVTAGVYADLPRCQRLNVTQGWDTCTVLSPEACLWSWKSHKCENGVAVPGKHHEDGCGSSVTSACNEWARFNLDHPIYNCRATICGDSPAFLNSAVTCLSMRQTLALTLSNGTAFRENETTSSEAVTAGVTSGLNLTSDTSVVASVDYSRRLSFAQDLLFDQPLEAEPRRATQVSDSTAASVTVVLGGLPKTLKTEAIESATEAIVSAINTAFGTSIITAAEWSGDPWYGTSTELETAVQQSCLATNANYDCDLCEAFNGRCIGQPAGSTNSGIPDNAQVPTGPTSPTPGPAGPTPAPNSQGPPTPAPTPSPAGPFQGAPTPGPGPGANSGQDIDNQSNATDP